MIQILVESIYTCVSPHVYAKDISDPPRRLV